MIDDLYDLIGGKRTIWAATESFYKKVLEHQDLRHFFERSDIAGLHARQSMFLSMLLGGEVVYTGKDVGTAHARAREAGLNDAHFDMFLKLFRESLDDVGVPPERADRVMKLLENQRAKVLNR
jgi:hemoglobin